MPANVVFIIIIIIDTPLSLQLYYSLWRRLLKPFWWLVVAYTMLVLIAIYTYQFEDFPDYWKNFTGFTEDQYAIYPYLHVQTIVLSSLPLVGQMLDLCLCVREVLKDCCVHGHKEIDVIHLHRCP